MIVAFNGKNYELKAGSGIQRQSLADFPGATRDTSQQQRTDRELMSSWEFSRLTYGSGIERMDIDEERDRESYWESTVDTRWKGKVLLPPLVKICSMGFTLNVVATIPIGTQYNRGVIFEYLGSNELVLVSETPSISNILTSSYGGEITRLPHLHKVASNSGGFVLNYLFPVQPLEEGVVTLNSPNSPISVVQTDRLFEYVYQGVWENNAAWYYAKTALGIGIMRVSHASTQASRSWAYEFQVGSGGNYLGRNLFPNWKTSPFYKYVGTMHIGVQHVPSQKGFIHPVMSGTYEDSAPTWRSEPHHPPHPGHTPDGLFAGHSDGLFLLNLTQRTYTEKMDSRHMASPFTNKGMVPFENENLLCTERASQMGKTGRLLGFNTVDNVIQSIGLDLDHGVPSAYTSEISAMLSAQGWLLAATARPESSGNRFGLSRLWAYDKSGWHFMAEAPSHSTPHEIHQLLLSSLESGADTIPRLWMVPTGNYNWPFCIEYPLSDPLMVEGYPYASQGVLIYPIYNAGMPEWPAVFMDMVVEGKQLSANERIEAYYGLDGAVPTQLLGIATQSGVTVMQFGSGLGVEGYSIQPQLIFKRAGSQSISPVLLTQHSPVIHFYKVPSMRSSYQFTADLGKNIQDPARGKYDDLVAAKNTRTLLPLHWGNVPTKNVKVVQLSGSMLAEGEMLGEETGEATVQVVEMF